MLTFWTFLTIFFFSSFCDLVPAYVGVHMMFMFERDSDLVLVSVASLKHSFLFFAFNTI